ncbi:hypothetical protein WRP3_032 [Lactococcus phage WRP3]|uniref:Uncharacterized protein n=2 Tax=Audreyjarvisvirus TaxID=2843351 RepID=V9VHU7_9CAUD|nr:hypothetical protein T548_0039 [Lactococcus phage phiL47]YP_009147689.1 hypothetical protein ACQ37_gp032 [Lactococcus phage WRP3]AHC94117.1 hypothetical protein T548_0039 [Lactococcus phage phiL47]AIX12535.1 hypothetical protein WRP3_032 [Lactococcus phage WRP3]
MKKRLTIKEQENLNKEFYKSGLDPFRFYETKRKNWDIPNDLIIQGIDANRNIITNKKA